HLIHRPKQFSQFCLLVFGREEEFLMLQIPPVNGWRKPTNRNIHHAVHKLIRMQKEREQLRINNFRICPKDESMRRTNPLKINDSSLPLIGSPFSKNNITRITLQFPTTHITGGSVT